MNDTNARRAAAAEAHEGRKRFRNAAKILDGRGETAHQNALTAIVAADDVLDAILHAEATDRALAGIERASVEPKL